MKEPRRIDRDVFAEESSKLTNVLALLTKRIQNLIKNKPYPDVNAYSVGWDYEERQDLQYKKECNSKVDEQLANLKEYVYHLPYPRHAIPCDSMVGFDK